MKGADQAEGLRRLLRAGTCRIVAVAGLSPGVGATTVAMNIAAAVAGDGKPVLFIDEHPDQPQCARRQWPAGVVGTLGDVAARRLSFGAAAPSIAPALRVLSAPPGSTYGSFNPRSLCPDGLVIVDLALAGTGLLSPLGRMADELLLVVQPSPASITATYAGLKRLQYAHALQAFRFAVNQASDACEAKQVAENIVATASRHLAVTLRCAGWIAWDTQVRQAAAHLDTVCHRHPDAEPAAQLRAIAAALLEGGEPRHNLHARAPAEASAARAGPHAPAPA
jgi:flagellar biosynthesis protein FlhG